MFCLYLKKLYTINAQIIFGGGLFTLHNKLNSQKYYRIMRLLNIDYNNSFLLLLGDIINDILHAVL